MARKFLSFNKLNHHLKMHFTLYMGYLCLILEFVYSMA